MGRDEGRREPIIHLPPIPTQKCMKPGPMPKQMPLSTEGAFIRAEMHRPTQHTLFRGGSQINPTRRCMSPSPRSRLGASEGGSESPPRPPPRRAPPPVGGGAFVPHVEPAGPPGTAHPLPTHRSPATWGQGRKRPHPSPTWEGARAHRLGGIPQAPRRQRIRTSNGIPGSGACGLPSVWPAVLSPNPATRSPFPTTEP